MNDSSQPGRKRGECETGAALVAAEPFSTCLISSLSPHPSIHFIRDSYEKVHSICQLDTLFYFGVQFDKRIQMSEWLRT